MGYDMATFMCLKSIHLYAFWASCIQVKVSITLDLGLKFKRILQNKRTTHAIGDSGGPLTVSDKNNNFAATLIG